MARASLVSLHLARFDSLRRAGWLSPENRPGVLFCAVAAVLRVLIKGRRREGLGPAVVTLERRAGLHSRQRIFRNNRRSLLLGCQPRN